MKKFYKEQEFVWVKPEKKKGKIQKIKLETKEVDVTVFNDKGVLEEKTYKLWEINKLRKKDTILFAKVKPDAKIPSKRQEDAGFDVYACFDEDYIKIEPHQTKLIPTGIATSFKSKYVFMLKERGSTGTKGLAQRCGVIDSGFQNEIFCPLTNTNDVPVYIKKPNVDITVETYAIIYPYEKAICQGILLPIPNVIVKEISYDELKEIPSERGMGQLGSTNK